MLGKLLGYAVDGLPVYDRPGESHNKVTEKLLSEALDFVSRPGVTTVEFDAVVGHNPCVQTTQDDEIVYIRRAGRSGETRFVRNKHSKPTKEITVILKEIRDGYMLVTSWYGGVAEPEPWDEQAFKRDRRGYDAAKAASVKFWENHALVK